MRAPWGSRRGQLSFPALFIFPSLMLFIWLIYETGRLSKEKIRHQFALDAAAFVEMTNYSDFLNRTAYVNGAFPMRIFDEGFHDTMISCDQKANCKGDKSLWEILYENGAFPRSVSGKRAFSDEPFWDIRYGEAGEGKNETPPELASTFEIIDEDDANHYWINWDEANQIYKLYVQIFQLLGAVEDAQYSVLKRLASEHSFLKKSYLLNTGDPPGSGDEAARAFEIALGPFSATPYCHERLNFFGNRPTGSAFQPFQIWTPEGQVDPKTGQHKKGVAAPDAPPCTNGLFQIMWVDQNLIRKLREPQSGNGFPGLPVSMPWAVPGKNYWNVNFNSMPDRFVRGVPEIHTTVSLGVDSKAAVWPNPTPKFQVRQFP